MAFVQVEKCLTDPKQLVKLILLVSCICISFYQLSVCVQKILNPPVSSHYTFKLNETIKYPSVTICRRPAYKNYLFPNFGLKQSTVSLSNKDAFKGFFFNSTTIQHFLEVTTYKMKNLLPMYGFKGDGNHNNVKVESFYLMDQGRCYTLTPIENAETFSVQVGYFFYLKHSVKEKVRDANGLSTSGFDVYFHPENEVLTEERNDLMQYLYLESSEDMQVTLTVQTYSLLPISSRPCVTTPGYSRSKCMQTCFHNYVAKAVGCTLPWLRNLNEEYPTCDDYDSVSLLIETYNHEANRKRELKRCNCVNACNNSLYSYHIQSRREADSVTAPSSNIIIFFSTNLISALSEVISYDWNVFLSDVGGSLGFLLGLSVIGVITIVEEGVRMFCCKREAKKEKANGPSLKTIMDFVVAEEDKVKYDQSNIVKF